MLTPKEIKNIFIERFAGYRNFQVGVRERKHPKLETSIIQVVASWQVDNMAHEIDVILDNEIWDRSTIDVLIDDTIKRHSITPVGTMDAKPNGKVV